MDFSILAQKVEEALGQQTLEFEVLVPVMDDGAMWGFMLANELSGFVTLEANLDTYNLPTLSIALSLGALEEVGREDLLDLLDLNGQLLGVSLTMTPALGEEQTEFLLLQTKFLAMEFTPENLANSLLHLETQLSIFFDYQ